MQEHPLSPEFVSNPFPPKPIPWIVIGIIVLVVGIASAFAIYWYLMLYQKGQASKQDEMTPTSFVQTPTPAAISTSLEVSAATPPASGCDVADQAFCNVLSDLKQSLTSGNYQGFLSYLTVQSVTCDPEGMAVALCEGQAKGVVKQGYSVGYNESEGSIQTQAAFLQTIGSYVTSNGPFSYRGSRVDGDNGVAVFLNSAKDKILVFPMKRTGLTWRMNYILVGGDFSEEFVNLRPSILERSQ